MWQLVVLAVGYIHGVFDVQQTRQLCEARRLSKNAIVFTRRVGDFKRAYAVLDEPNAFAFVSSTGQHKDIDIFVCTEDLCKGAHVVKVCVWSLWATESTKEASMSSLKVWHGKTFPDIDLVVCNPLLE